MCAIADTDTTPDEIGICPSWCAGKSSVHAAHRRELGTYGTDDGTTTLTISIVQNRDESAVVRQVLHTPSEDTPVNLAPASARRLARSTLKIFGLDKGGPLGPSGAVLAVRIAASLVAAADMIDGA